MIVFKKVK